MKLKHSINILSMNVSEHTAKEKKCTFNLEQYEMLRKIFLHVFIYKKNNDL